MASPAPQPPQVLLTESVLVPQESAHAPALVEQPATLSHAAWQQPPASHRSSVDAQSHDVLQVPVPLY